MRKMHNEDEIKNQARLGAIEFALCELFAMIYQGGNATSGYVHGRHDHWIDIARSQGVAGVDHAQSDLLSGELENALRDLSRLIETHARFPRQNPPA
jgi:hypothetical protein